VIFVLDNYDSFTYNLVQYIGELGVQDDNGEFHVEVRRNDQVTVAEVASMHPEKIVVSPGPCTPREAGISVDLIRHFAGKVPVLGVCLGHQAIGAVFGGSVVRATVPMHGKTSTIEHDGRGVFAGIDGPFTASRYHSLVVADEGLPADLEVTARTREDRTIMGLRHVRWPIHGVQFHPESILTAEGRHLLRNFLGTRV
jgi:anthranilate synthase/aminodeoxychorismate synthase-like glutamine amidotransferase